MKLSFVKVDLFFYREPEETKEQEEDELPVGDYAGDYTTAAPLGGADQWNQIPDAQWGGDVVQPAIPAVPAGTWTESGEFNLAPNSPVFISFKITAPSKLYPITSKYKPAIGGDTQ